MFIIQASLSYSFKTTKLTDNAHNLTVTHFEEQLMFIQNAPFKLKLYLLESKV